MDAPMIFINPGHGGTDTGAVSGPFVEKTLNLTVGLYLRDILRSMGYGVYMTREADVKGGQTNIMSQMKTLLKTTPIALAVSIHHNAGGGIGCEVFRQAKSDKSLQFANAINEEFKKTGQTSRGVKTKLLSNGDDYYFFNREPYKLGVVSVLTEYAFVDNPKSTVFIDSPEDLKKEAQAIANGIHKIIGYKPPVQAPVTRVDCEECKDIAELKTALTAAQERAEKAEKEVGVLKAKIEAAKAALM